MRTHRWSQAKALKVLLADETFLSFKKTFEDWNASKFSPSILVDLMWHQHLIENKNYSKDCELLFDQVIYHHPDGGLDPEAREERIKTTTVALRIQYPDGYDEKIWNFGVRRGEMEDREASRSRVETDDHMSFPIVPMQM